MKRPQKSPGYVQPWIEYADWLEAERDRLLEAIRKHRAQFTKETPVRAVDLELWQRLEE